MELFARSIGAQLRDLPGLRAAYVPAGVSHSAAYAIVEAANVGNTDELPRAILISSSLGNEPDVATVSPEAATAYRHGQRLAVVMSTEDPPASFTQTFSDVMGSDFPASLTEASVPLGFDSLASAALRELVRFAPNGQGLIFDRPAVEELISQCLQLCKEAYEATTDSSIAWNALWFRHVSEALANLASAIERSFALTASPTADEFFATYTRAAFALPRADHSQKSRLNGKTIAEAIDAWWSSEEALTLTSHYLDRHAETLALGPDGHPISAIEWSKFDQQAAARESTFLALCFKPSTAHAEFMTGFAALTEDQFLNPIGAQPDGIKFAVQGPDGESFAVGCEPEIGPFVIQVLGDIDTSTVQESEEFRIQVPVLGGFEPADLSMTELGIETDHKQVDIQGEFEVENHQLRFYGRFFVMPQYFAAARRTVNLTIASRSQADSIPRVDPSLKCQVILAPANHPGLLVTPRKASGKTGRTSYSCPSDSFLATGKSTPEGPYPIDLKSTAETLDVLMWGANSLSDITMSNAVANGISDRSGLFAAAFQPSGEDLVTISDSVFAFSTETKREVSLSPAVAAISCDLPSTTDDLPDSVRDSAQGAYEGLLTRNIDNPDWVNALWHLACSDEVEHPLEPGTSAGLHSPVMNAAILVDWQTSTDFAVLPEVAESLEAQRFGSCFQALDVANHLRRRLSDDDYRIQWPSRTAWRHLWESSRELLSEYLDSYTALVALARKTRNPGTIFWASYPFSLSSWRTKTNGRCVAVLLSPLHPLRLAWLAGVESALWNSTNARALAGTVEGWNFPLIGPRGKGHGRMLAVPIDNGLDQLFLGWSMLVAVAGDDYEQLSPARRFGGYLSPGASGSGLNGTAVAAALRSYRRMHPHVTTMNIDLSCAVTSPRLDEVDQSVLSAVKMWTDNTENSAPLGGIRVSDSLNRTGDIPRAALRKLLSSGVDVPVSWSRYDPAQGTPHSNLKVLQDAGVTVQLTTNGHASNGVAASWPLRRFEALGSDRSQNNDSQSNPGIMPGRGWRPFTDAIREFEWADLQPLISAKLHHASIADGRSDWTVSGDSMMNPNAMASLLSTTAGGEQMLWEWRPPHLEPSDNIPQLERRPFISVARVPGTFRDRLGSLLATAADGDTPADVDLVLGRLGARGVGLSSLLSMGGTHASGAIGFDRAFSLLDQHADVGGELLVLPIDACDAFLRALAGEASADIDNRRADLLALRLTESEVALVPIEIKCYGLQANHPSGTLPGMGSSQMDEALGQLGTTVSLLEVLVAQWTQRTGTGSPADIALWANALATLVETGIRLSPNPKLSSSTLGHCLEKILAGEMPIRVGRPLVTYFKHAAYTSDGKGWDVFRGRSDVASHFEYGALSCNLGMAFQSENNARLSRDWTELLSWAFEAIESPAADGSAIPLQSVTNREIADEPVPSQTHQATDESIAAEDSVPPTPKEPLPDFIHERFAQSGAEYDGVKFPVGHAIDSFSREGLNFWPSNTELTQMNIGVVGDLGTGKTQLLKALVSNLLTGSRKSQPNPLSILIFDYKRDFQENSFVQATDALIIQPENIPLNFFELPSGYTKQAAFKRAKSFYDVLARIYKGVGPVQRQRLVTTITDLYELRGGTPPLMSDVAAAYSLQAGQADSVTSILQDFVMGEVFSDDPDTVVDFRTLLDGKVLVVALDKLGADQNQKNALVILFLNLYYEYMLGAKKWPFEGNNPQLRRLNSFLLVDEATNIMQYEFDVLMTLMLQGREFGFGTILASQYLSHFNVNSTNYGEPLLTWFVHRVPQAHPQDLKKVGLQDIPKSTAERIPGLGLHEAIYRSLQVPGRIMRGTPFYEILDN